MKVRHPLDRDMKLENIARQQAILLHPFESADRNEGNLELYGDQHDSPVLSKPVKLATFRPEVERVMPITMTHILQTELWPTCNANVND